MNAFDVLTILLIPARPKLLDSFNFVGMMRMIDVTFLAGQEVYNHDDISEEDYF
jgi:hypothetical protein